MAIQVTCPSCLKRFSVSDKFAGRTGPCPSCQKPIKIPEKADEVVIHAPEDAGPKDSAGKAILKPIKRTEVKIPTPLIVGCVIAAVAVFAIALGLGLSGEAPPAAVMAIGAILLAPPLVFVGYWFLHDDELEGFDGRQLMVRVAICALSFAALWAIFAFVPAYVSGDTERTGVELAIYLPIMIILGTLISLATLELEAAQAIMHYVLYLGITLVLAWLSGAPIVGSPEGGPGVTPPPATAPDQGESQAPEQTPTTPGKQVPKLLQ